jgi:hypothetical protein
MSSIAHQTTKEEIINNSRWIRLMPEDAVAQYLAAVLSEKASSG